MEMYVFRLENQGADGSYNAATNNHADYCAHTEARRLSFTQLGDNPGVKYDNKFFLVLLTRNASFTLTKYIRKAEITPMVEQRYIDISKSYGEGTAHFDGNDVRIHGHVEHVSTLKQKRYINISMMHRNHVESLTQL